MIEELEKEIEKMYKQLDEADLNEISKGEPWPVRLGDGTIQYVQGESHYGFLLGQWRILKYILSKIDQLKYEEKRKHRTNAFVFRPSEVDE